MKRSLVCWAIAFGLLLSVAGLAMAQDSTTTQQSTTTTTTTTDNSATNPSTSQSSTLPSDKDSAMTPSQDTATPVGQTDKSSNVRTITGCLQKGDSASEYQLTGQDGSTWELRSDAVDLASHVGHTVTITGEVRNAGMHGMKEDAKKEAQEHGMDKSATEHGHMTVTNVTMVSNSCS